MILITKRPWEMYDSQKPRNEQTVVIEAGTYEVERVENPYGYKNAPWLVLKGTTVGRTETSLREWRKVAKTEFFFTREKRRFDLLSYKVLIKKSGTLPAARTR